LITYRGALSGTLPAMGVKPSGFSCTINTNTAGQVRLVVQTETPPVFKPITASDGNLSFSGTGGPTNVPYYVLMTTNLALPVANWTRLATNQFDASGSFNFSNTINPDAPQTFYRLQLP
jgi:hypothetical protein